MQDITIRCGQPDDIKQIQSLNYQLFLHDAKRFDDMNVEWPYQPDGIAYFTERLSGQSGICYVAQLEDKIIGYIAGALSKPTTGYLGLRTELENIIVQNGSRSQGAGSKLVSAFYDWCRQQSVTYVWVEPYISNQRAVQFYKQQGFAEYQLKLLHEL